MQKMQEMDQGGGPHGQPDDRNTLNKLMALHPGLNSSMPNNQHLVGRGALTGSAQPARALTNYQSLLMRQNSMNSNHNNSSLQQEASSPFNTPSQTPTTPGPGPGPSGILPGNMQNSPVGGFSSGHQVSQRQQSPGRNGLLQQNQAQSSQGSQALQQQMIHQLLQDMSNKRNNGAAVPQGPQQSLPVQNQGGTHIPNNDSLSFRSSPATTSAGNGPGDVARPPSRSNSFKAASNSEPPAQVGSMGYSQKTSDLPQNFDDFVSDFTENGFFNNDLDDNMNFSWKA